MEGSKMTQNWRNPRFHWFLNFTRCKSGLNCKLFFIQQVLLQNILILCCFLSHISHFDLYLPVIGCCAFMFGIFWTPKDELVIFKVSSNLQRTHFFSVAHNEQIAMCKGMWFTSLLILCSPQTGCWWCIKVSQYNTIHHTIYHTYHKSCM